MERTDPLRPRHQTIWRRRLRAAYSITRTTLGRRPRVSSRAQAPTTLESTTRNCHPSLASRRWSSRRIALLVSPCGTGVKPRRLAARLTTTQAVPRVRTVMAAARTATVRPCTHGASATTAQLIITPTRIIRHTRNPGTPTRPRERIHRIHMGRSPPTALTVVPIWLRIYCEALRAPVLKYQRS